MTTEQSISQVAKPLKVAITGASGYLGSGLVQWLLDRDHHPIALVRNRPVANLLNRPVRSLTDVDDLCEATVDCDAIVHLAAINHRLDKLSEADMSMVRDTNVGYTEALARAAIRNGIERFVFVSSIKVNGEQTRGRPFTASDQPRPQDFYGITKYEAEKALASLSRGSGFRPIIIRPPLIYGGDAKGNLALLLRAVARGMPLPLAGIRNHRSLVSLPLICEFIEICLRHPNAPGHTFLVSDDVARSTPEIVRLISAEHGYSPRLFYCPRWLLRPIGRLLGKLDMLSRLTGDLVVDTEATKRILGWDPAVRAGQRYKR